MSNLSIKNVPEDLVIQLRARAKTNHRSLQGELLSLISAAVHAPDLQHHRGVPALGETTGTKSIEQVAAEHRASQLQPIADAPLAVDLVRRSRDGKS